MQNRWKECRIIQMLVIIVRRVYNSKINLMLHINLTKVLKLALELFAMSLRLKFNRDMLINYLTSSKIKVRQII